MYTVRGIGNPYYCELITVKAAGSSVDLCSFELVITPISSVYSVRHTNTFQTQWAHFIYSQCVCVHPSLHHVWEPNVSCF